MENFKQPKAKPLITYPYRGSRRSWFVYHPALHGMSSADGQWEKCSERFKSLLENFCAVCEMYTDQQIHHETVGGSKWKQDVEKLWRAIELDGDKDVYQLEALATVIFSVEQEEKSQQRTLPYHSEIKEAAGHLRHEDFGLSLDGLNVDPRHLIRRTWSS